MKLKGYTSSAFDLHSCWI